MTELTSLSGQLDFARTVSEENKIKTQQKTNKQKTQTKTKQQQQRNKQTKLLLFWNKTVITQDPFLDCMHEVDYVLYPFHVKS